jgi:mannose/fructose/N-acetylgalactosamine-specific phosphotransferase system component IID
MRQVLTVYDCIRENNIKTVLLIFLFPLLFIFWMCLLPFLYYLALWIMGGFIVFPYQFFILASASIFGFVFIWTLIAYRFGPKMIMSFAGAKKNRSISKRI